MTERQLRQVTTIIRLPQQHTVHWHLDNCALVCQYHMYVHVHVHMLQWNSYQPYFVQLRHCYVDSLCTLCCGRYCKLNPGTGDICMMILDDCFQANLQHLKVWLFCFRTLQDHVETCDYRDVQCTLCGQHIQLLTLSKHQKTECPMRPQQCIHCGEDVPAQQMQVNTASCLCFMKCFSHDTADMFTPYLHNQVGLGGC